MATLKEKIHEECLRICRDRLLLAENELKQLSASAAEDTKSSAGDKYETGRDMINLEKEKIAENLNGSMKMMAALSQIDPFKIQNKVERGSLVTTDKGCFYVSTSLGSIKIDDKSYFAISPIAPIGQAMLGKSSGDSFEFNGVRNQIIDLS